MHTPRIGSRTGADRIGRRVLGRAIGIAAVASLVACGPVVLRPASGLAATSTSGGTSHVLLVGTWHGRTGQFRSIQAAVSAARPGDWILVAPGDYHESPTASVGVRITTPDLHLIGLDRNTVVVDGDRPGAPSACNPNLRWRNLGPGGTGREGGRDGIVVTASGVVVENLTVCNFLGTRRGRQVVFSGGPGGRLSTVGAFTARYLTTTSTILTDVNDLAAYGIYVSNVIGPGVVANDLATNMANSALHIGACRDCNMIFTQNTALNSVIGLTAIDAGGRLLVEHSVFQGNASGIDLASEEDESSPPPQDGACPAGYQGPEALSPRSCTVVRDNLVDGNDTPNVPGGGTLRFLGAGILVPGGINDAVVANRVRNQGSDGIVLTIFPVQGRPSYPSAHCQGGLAVAPNRLCVFTAFGDVVAANHLSHNGSFGNPTNGDLAEATLAQRQGNCFSGNVAAPGRGVTTYPVGLQRPASACGAPSGGAFFGPLGAQIACATGAFGQCDGTPAPIIGVLESLARALHVDAAALRSPGVATSRAQYPPYVSAKAPRPPAQPTMPDPCRGAPANAWC